MRKFRRKLPPMTSLAAFEASARTLSFTKAAEELFVTQAAISRQIASLENNLGIMLFVRSHRKIALTPLGQEFQHSITTALDLIEHSSRKLRTIKSTTQVTISADMSMAYRWLLPRFEKFHNEFPDISVKIISSDNEQESLHPEVDIALLYGNGHWKNYDAKELIEEEIFPVCHPDFLIGKDIRSLKDVHKYDLLDLEGKRWDWVDWKQWLTQVDASVTNPLKTTSFNSFPLLIEATLLKQGIGLGWNGLVDDLIEKKSLVRLFNQSLKTGRGYYILTKGNIGLTRNARILYDWLIENKN